MAKVLVDTRWRGVYGIARFSSEVLPRLEPHAVLAKGVKPCSALDPLYVAAYARAADATLTYSPGFNGSIASSAHLLTIHDLIHLDDNQESSAVKRLYYEKVVKPTIQRTGRVLTVSNSTKHRLERWLDRDRIDVVNVGNGCSEAFFSRAESQKVTQSSARPFIYVGNCKPHKNFELILKALRLVSSAELLVVSTDQLRVGGLAEAYGVSRQVTLVRSPVSDEELAALYRGSQALIMPSLREGFGLPAVESLASGTPVIYYAGCASVKEIVRDAGACLHDPGDDVELATLLRDMTGREKKSIEFDAEMYKWSSVATRVEKEIKRWL